LERHTRYDEKLARILDSACEIFAQKGYHNASVRDVAAATGVSPAGLYYYFESKEELLHLILDSCLVALMERVRDRAMGIQDPSFRLKTIVRVHLAHYEAYRTQMKVLIHEWETLSGSFGEDIRRLMREYARLVVRTFKEISPHSDSRDLRAAAFGLFGMLTWVDKWHRPGRDLPMDQLADRFTDIYLKGFLAAESWAAIPEDGEKSGTAQEWSRKDRTSSILSGPGF
jgi:AcrR family transcriptional regulator